MSHLYNLIAVSSALFAAPRGMPQLNQELNQPSSTNRVDQESSKRKHSASTSDYGMRKNHPTSYDDNPPFKGPLKLEQTNSPDTHRRRIRGFYLDDELLRERLHISSETFIEDCKANNDVPRKTSTISPAKSSSNIIKSVLDHLAISDAPVDAKEVAESCEFYLRSGKRLLGAARRMKNRTDSYGSKQEIVVHDLCSGHGLTGMLFVACNPPRPPLFESLRTILVDHKEPRSHSVLRDCISEICPWVSKDTVQFMESSLQEYKLEGDNGTKGNISDSTASIVISTHACGSLTDQVLRHAVDCQAASIAVMPCCYTDTDAGAPYGVRRILGVA
eukprot:CAMPEP_0171371422 /NCGR_PEP_ID=MMETSP0879-20121228/8629_1 /TAXON_ID=67004 /ORGANISM="Thalassiosira weissflogii, Strain CCMP1336" /LENGTH=331 /DNA_ID=CAMNT_0011880015 /DNA_START=345 /DNA_END=1336 /DNA_ORIENTATION=+